MPPWTDFRPSVHLSISVHIFKFLMVPRPNPSTRSPQNYNLGPMSESVHEMDGLSPNFGPLSTWTGERMDGP